MIEGLYTSERGCRNPVQPLILVIGLGNPILGDDGIGWRVAEQVQSTLSEEIIIEVDFLSLGGLSLMERLIGYDRVVIIDSLTTRSHPVGTVSSFPLSALPDNASGHTTSTHDTSLQSAIQAGKSLGAHLPDKIWIVGVETDFVQDFSEELSPPITAAVPIATETVLNLLIQWNEEDNS